MKSKNDYYKFLIKFLYLADKAQMSDTKYKYELNMKLSFSLQKMMIQKYLKINFFQKFSTYCSQMIQTLKKINRAENHTHRPGQPTRETPNISNTPRYPALSDSEWAQLF